jgi:protein-tyrosine phosphatase
MRAKVAAHGLDWIIDSAGTESYHIGEAPHLLSQRICKQHGIDISGQRARKLTREDLKSFDLVYAMATDVYREIAQIAGHESRMEKVILFLDELQQGTGKSVPDPYYGSKQGYTVVYDLVNATCDAIIEKYQKREL